MLCAICIVTIVVLGYVNYRVIKIVKLKDPVIVLMLLFLKLSLLSFAIFYGFEASVVQHFVCYDRMYFCMTGMFVGWPAVFLAIALMLTLNKWMSYIVLVQHINSSDGQL